MKIKLGKQKEDFYFKNGYFLESKGWVVTEKSSEYHLSILFSSKNLLFLLPFL